MAGSRAGTKQHRSTRRAFLGGMAASAAATILAACGSGPVATSTPVANTPISAPSETAAVARAGTVVTEPSAVATNTANRSSDGSTAVATTATATASSITATPIPSTATATRMPPTASATRPPATATPFSPTATPAPRLAPAVYVLTNQESGNGVVVFRRGTDGKLTLVGIASTGGRGIGDTPDGAGLDSQGALALSADGRLLFAANAGSGDVSVFTVQENGITLVDRVPSNGPRPISLTTHGAYLYVLNFNRQSPGNGNISGFAIGANNRLTPLSGSARPLSTNGNVNPGQVQFSPKGDLLVVTEKMTNKIVTYTVASSGFASLPITQASGGETPFALAFANPNLFVTADAFGDADGRGAASSYGVGDRGSIRLISKAIPDQQSAACWVATTADGKYAYVANGLATAVSGYRIDQFGNLSLLNADGVTGRVGAGQRDLALSSDSRYLYVLNSQDGTVSIFAVRSDGSLQSLGLSGTFPAPGGSGLVAR